MASRRSERQVADGDSDDSGNSERFTALQSQETSQWRGWRSWQDGQSQWTWDAGQSSQSGQSGQSQWTSDAGWESSQSGQSGQRWQSQWTWDDAGQSQWGRDAGQATEGQLVAISEQSQGEARASTNRKGGKGVPASESGKATKGKGKGKRPTSNPQTRATAVSEVLDEMLEDLRLTPIAGQALRSLQDYGDAGFVRTSLILPLRCILAPLFSHAMPRCRN